MEHLPIAGALPPMPSYIVPIPNDPGHQGRGRMLLPAMRNGKKFCVDFNTKPPGGCTANHKDRRSKTLRNGEHVQVTYSCANGLHSCAAAKSGSRACGGYHSAFECRQMHTWAPLTKHVDPTQRRIGTKHCKRMRIEGKESERTDDNPDSEPAQSPRDPV